MPDLTTAMRALHQDCVDSRDAYRKAVASMNRGLLKVALEDILDRREAKLEALAPYLSARNGAADCDASPNRCAAGANFLFRHPPRADDGWVRDILAGEKRLLERCDSALEAAGADDPEYELLRLMHDEQSMLVDAVESLFAEA